MPWLSLYWSWFYFSLFLAQLFHSSLSKKLLKLAKLIAQGKDETIVTIQSRDEFGELASSFNTMVESIQKEKAQNEEQSQEMEKAIAKHPPGSHCRAVEEMENGRSLIPFPNVTILFANITVDLSKIRLLCQKKNRLSADEMI